jgi:hypothetical protein
MTVETAIEQLHAAAAIRIVDGRVRYSLREADKESLSCALEVLRRDPGTTMKAACELLSRNDGHTETASLSAGGVDYESSVVVNARRAVNRSGCRQMDIDGVCTIGVWSDLDSAEIRRALAVLGKESFPMLYLDAPGVPDRYKVRAVPGEPVPSNVLAAMRGKPTAPWSVRDALLAEIRQSFAPLRATNTVARKWGRR